MRMNLPGSRRPDWVKDAIFYQIFPDRFAKSELLEKPANLQPWGAPPTHDQYQGGDLLGIVERLDYLVELGVNALYLNPIFQSASNHRYHTHDYRQVDPLLGGNRALRLLVDEAHRRDVRVVLDGVFNHASRGFFQFNDILENGPNSPWLDWFTVEGWPIAAYDGREPANYVSWHRHRALPKFNTDNPQVREFLMSTAEYWLSEFDIDGWRLDVPEEIRSDGFWEEFRERIKRVKPDAYLVGEIWRQAPEWLQGDRFDGLMNYPLAAAIIAFVAGERVSSTLVADRPYDPYPSIDAVGFGKRIRRLLDGYDWETNQAQLNILDSHDTPRLLSLARGDRASVQLATLFQMVYPGAPCIYYGNEIGLRGTTAYDEPHQDPDARWAFPWHDRSSWDMKLLGYFKKVTKLRQTYPVLRNGRFEQLATHGSSYAFARQDNDETLIIVINAGEEAAHLDIPINNHFGSSAAAQTVFGAGTVRGITSARLSLTVPARDGIVLAEV